MRNSIKIGLLLLITSFSSNTISAQNTKATIKNPTSQKARPIIKKETLYVDVRTAAEFAQGSVKGAVNIPLDQVENQLIRFKGKKSIVVFCQSGSRSSQAKAILEQNHITNVINGGRWEDVNAKLKK